MPNIYEGNIKSMYVSKLQINNGIINCVTGEEVIIKNAKFYTNFIGREISFDYDTYLPTRMEAQDYINNGAGDNVLFVDYNELRYLENVDKKTIKSLKKEYKKK